MVGDGDVVEAARDGGFGHLADGVAAVGFGGVHVQIAADVAADDELGQRVFGGGFELAAVLAQLGRDVVEVERVVDRLFGFGGDDLVVFEAEESVLAEGEAALDGALAQGDVVMLGAGEVLQRGAVAGAGEQADVDLQVVAQGEADLVLAAREELVDEGEGGDVLDGRGDDVGLAGGAGDEQVEVADGLAAAAQGAGGGDGLDAGEDADEFADALGVLAGDVDAEARGVLAIVLNAFEELVGKLLAHAGEGQEVAALGGLFEGVDIADAECGVDEGDGLGAHAGKAEQLEHGGLVAAEEFFAQRHGAGGDEVADVGGHAFADARDGEERLGVGVGCGERGELRGLLLYGFGGAAIGANAKGIGCVDLQQCSGLIEQSRKGNVVHKRSKARV